MSQRATSTVGRNLLGKPLNRFTIPICHAPCATSALLRVVPQSALRHVPCATSTLPRVLLLPDQRWDRTFATTHAWISPPPLSPIPAEGIVGQSGHRYRILKLLGSGGGPGWGAHFLAARDDGTKAVLEEEPYFWRAKTHIYELAAGSRHVRLPIDTVPERNILVFEHLDTKRLVEVEQDLSLSQVKRILHCTLQGIADLHARKLWKGDIAPENVLVRMTDEKADAHIEKVIVTSFYHPVPLATYDGLKGSELWNFIWRSFIWGDPAAYNDKEPESLRSDMFAFRNVCVYAVFKFVVLKQPDAGSTEDSRAAKTIFKKMTYFGDGRQEYLDGIKADNSVEKAIHANAKLFGDDAVVKHPSADGQLPTPGLDNDFKDLVNKLGVITAQEALAHRYFKDV